MFAAFSLSLPAQATEYFRACHDNDSDYLKTALNIQDSSWVITHTAFEDNTCETPYLKFEIQYQTQQSGQNIDMKTTEVSYTILTEEVTMILNDMNWCGFNDWKASQKKVVTGKVCDEFQTPKLNEVLYSIVEFKDSELYLGMPTGKYNGKTAEKRHQKLDPLGYTFSNTLTFRQQGAPK